VDCKEVLDQLSDYVDDEVRAELCRQIDEHLARCGNCKIHVDTVRKMILLYHIEANVETPVVVTQRLQRAMDNVYASPPEPPAD
jgi:anti-sigma factor RsiW